MKMLNSIILEGRMTNKPVLKVTPKGTALCVFSIATNWNYQKDNEFVQETSFFNVEAWARLAEQCEQYGIKGRSVRVVGRLKQDRWTGSDGKNYSKVKIIAEHLEFKSFIKKG
ncbi:single-stranded DNA-binding protein [Treponema denticola]|uniref:single-stranded DNA-binding protein n=1 Tax=Treponema denticola TaxID=158 RepID=UPI0020A4136F|nr:single-stranded DNA-binding protein [Treponema denticola]UTC93188.1 single-stranded DNA-binding protein [Treponema denticola]